MAICRVATGIPTQSNADDCGVFVLQYAERASRNAQFNFRQKDMQSYRASIIVEIMNFATPEAVA